MGEENRAVAAYINILFNTQQMYCLIIRNIQDITFDLLKDTDNVKIIMQRVHGSEGGVTEKQSERYNDAGFEDGEDMTRNVGNLQKLERQGNGFFFRTSRNKQNPVSIFISGQLHPCCTSNLQNCKIIYLWCLKPLSMS